MVDVSGNVFGVGATYNGRAVKIRDIDYDGDNDIVLGTTWVQQSQLFLNDGGGNFTNATDPNLPAEPAQRRRPRARRRRLRRRPRHHPRQLGHRRGLGQPRPRAASPLWSQTDKPGMFGEPRAPACSRT
jgi:hypothetical protein